MQIRLLSPFQLYKANQIVSLASDWERYLILTGQATYDLTGGIPYVPSAAARKVVPASLVLDGAGSVLGIEGPGGTLIPVSGSATVPGRPAKPVLTAMAGAVSLAWVPGAAGSTPTTGNIWTDINGNVTQLITNPQLITAPAGAPYTGTVTTLNAQGAGPASLQADAVSPVGKEVARVWQLNPGYSNAASVYNSGGGTIADGETDITATGMLITELEGRAKSIRVISMNMSRVNTRRVTGVTAVCPPALGDKKYDPLFAAATPQGWGGVMEADVPVVPVNATSPGLLVSDRIPITPVARTDIPGGKFLVALRERAFYPANMSGSSDQHSNPAKWPVPYFTHSGADWGVAGQGMYYGAGVKGDSLTAPFPGTPSPTANCPILGIVIEYENGAMGWAWFGSSFFKNDLESLANKRGAGFIMEATIAASTPQRPVEFINGGQASQTLAKALICASNTIPLLRPTHVVVEFANPNNFAMVSESTISAARSDSNAIIALAEGIGARPILFNGWARNTSSLPCTAPYFDAAQDLLLKSYRAEMAGRGYRIIDSYTGMSAGASPDYAKMVGNGFAKDYVIAKAGDGLHVTRDGTTDVLTPVTTAAINAEAAVYFA